MEQSSRIALSGGPGSGKTTVLTGLAARGYRIVAESARRLINDRKARGLSPRPVPLEFAKSLVEMDIAQYNSLVADQGTTFFDRTLLDSLCMLDAEERLSFAHRDSLVNKYPYNPVVFMFPPWEEIYCMDAERDQSFEQAIIIHTRLTSWYFECGYEIVTVAPGTMEERSHFILESLGE